MAVKVFFSSALFLLTTQYVLPIDHKLCNTDQLRTDVSTVLSCRTSRGVSVDVTTYVTPAVKCDVPCPGDGSKFRTFTCDDGRFSEDFRKTCSTSISISPHSRQKRFLGGLIGGLIIGCILFCGRSQRNVDQSPPRVTCPASQRDVIAEPAQWSAKVYYSYPTAHDDSDGPITPSLGSGYPSGWHFSEGTTKVSYYARDRRGNYGTCSFHVTVRVIRCKLPTRIDNGYYWCYPSDDHRYGTQCKYGCFPGYEMHGDKFTQCAKAGIWEGFTPSCNKIQCPVLTPVTNGEWVCSDSNFFRSTCSMKCKPGYDIPVDYPRVAVCSRFRIWRGIRNPPCRDIEKPVFTSCPVNQIALTERKKTTATPMFPHPRAKDNSGPAVTITQTKGRPSGSALKSGMYEIEFTAEDLNYNVAICRFVIIVRSRTCPFIYPTPSLQVTCAEGYGYGSKCTMQCEEGSSLEGNAVTSCETIPNSKAVAWNFGQTQPTCLGKKCPALQPPQNGAFACDLWLYGSFCQLLCRNGTDIARFDVGMVPSLYVCQDSGTWSATHVPKCSATTYSKTRLFSSAYYFNGNCNSTDVQNEIKAKFIAVLQNSDYATVVCTTGKSQCATQNVRVTCGTGRVKRDVNEANVKIEMDVSLTVPISEAQELQYKIIQSLDDVVKPGFKFDSGETFTADLSKTYHSKIEVQCQDGSVPSASESCALCPPGTSFDTKTKSCRECQLGSYQSESGKLSCINCPAGQTTTKTGTTHESQCIDMCPPGTFSPYRVKPCSVCERGWYTTSYGEKTCRQCPWATTTAQEQSYSKTQCKSFDILFPPSANGPRFANLTKRGKIESLNLSLSFSLLNEVENQKEVISLVSLSMGSPADKQIFDLKIRKNGFLELQYLGSDIQIGFRPQPNTWHHILLKTNNNDLTIYDSGEEMISKDLTNNKWDDILVNFDTDVHLRLGQNKEKGDGFVGSITNVNFWDKDVPVSVIYPQGGACRAPHQDALISWNDFTSAAMNDVSAAIPSVCDDVNECTSKPCGEHDCVDLLNGYKCNCGRGFNGTRCEINIDECAHHACENNATCVDGDNQYTCVCHGRYKGEFCDIQIIDGEWSDYGNWSICSATCGGGTRKRRRLCDSPAPGPDGVDCAGNDTEVEICNDNPCPVCETLKAPDNGYLDCNESADIQECTIRCEQNHDFSFPPKPLYRCGVSTFHQWDFQTKENPHGRLPSCQEIVPADSYTIEYDLVQSEDDSCKNADQLNQEIEKRIRNTLPCIKKSECEMQKLQVLNCDSSADRNKRDVNSKATIRVTIFRGGMQTTQQETIDEETIGKMNTSLAIMEEAGAMLNQSALEGRMDVQIGDKVYRVNVEDSSLKGKVGCPDGMTRVLYYCVYCSPGTYEIDDYCELCPIGTYQKQRGTTTCLKCPPGLMTAGTGSIDVSECDVPTSTLPATTTEESVKLIDTDVDHSVTVAVSVAVGTIAISSATIITVLCCKRIQKKKKKQQSVHPTSNRRTEKAEDLSGWASRPNSVLHPRAISPSEMHPIYIGSINGPQYCEIANTVSERVILPVPPLDTKTSFF